MCAGTHGSQKMVSDLLELELQTVVSHLTWMLKPELRYSGKAANTLNPQNHLSSPTMNI